MTPIIGLIIKNANIAHHKLQHSPHPFIRQIIDKLIRNNSAKISENTHEKITSPKMIKIKVFLRISHHIF